MSRKQDSQAPLEAQLNQITGKTKNRKGFSSFCVMFREKASENKGIIEKWFVRSI